MSRDHRLSADYQRSVRDFVGREVIYCVSSLVHTVLTAGYECHNSMEIDEDEARDLQCQDDWENPGRYYIEQAMERDALIDALDSRQGVFVADEMSIEELRKQLIDDVDEEDDWPQFCADHDIDPDQCEVYEHWIVSGWLADKLEAHGEVVNRDFLGLTIWGRCTTGQSISMDGVIEAIYDELHAKDLIPESNN